MTMTQSYYGGDFDCPGRQNYRAHAGAGHYDRPAPYSHGYYEPPYQDLRSDYAEAGRTLIQEQSSECASTGHPRRRIQVACSRCRRRKIKCTGDPGDGSGCSACRSAGVDRSSCAFTRVGSVAVTGVDMLSSNGNVPSATPTSTSYGSDAPPSSYVSSSDAPQHRPSLRMLQTRTAYPEYDSYNTSPVGDYTYASSSFSRHESFPSSKHGAEGFRPYSTGSMSTPSTTAGLYYEPSAAWSFGNLQNAAGYTSIPPSTRLPSVTAEPFSPLNMGSLHSSLPSQTVQERRLPMPYTQQQPVYTQTDVPQIRPLTSLTEQQPRINRSGTHSRSSIPWSAGSSGTGSGRLMSSNLPAELPLSSSAPSGSALLSESVLGYSFSTPSNASELSSTPTGPTLSESFSSISSSSSASSSMLPPSSTIRNSIGSTLTSLPTPSGSQDQRRPSSSHDTEASLYSFSTGVDASGRSTPVCHLQNHGTSNAPTGHPRENGEGRRPQTQHAATVDEIRRRPSHDQRRQHATPQVHRISASSVNGGY